MKEREDSWIIEWSQRQGQFHIESSTTASATVDDWRQIGMIWGTFSKASEFAREWLKKNPEAKKAYNRAVHF